MASLWNNRWGASSRGAWAAVVGALLFSAAHCVGVLTQPALSFDGGVPDGGMSDGGAQQDGGSQDGGTSDAGAVLTAGGVLLPAGWTLKTSDRFGLGASCTVSNFAQLHQKYFEGQFYNRDSNGLVLIPNVVINHEQETYVHFETAMVFEQDHLTVQARGQPDASITSGEMVSVYTARSFCTEARYQIPSADKSWPAFWFFAASTPADKSEIDFEQPVTPNQGVHDVSLYNHPPADAGDLTIFDPAFTTAYMTWSKASFDASNAPHYYTACYDDDGGAVTRYLDGQAIYRARWRWNASLGGTGHGPDATTIVNLAVGGDWPGNTPNPSTYSGDLLLYSIEYYGP